jgi:predicted PurR-regulated permease PerM
MKTEIKLPFYVQASLFLIGGYVFISILSILQDILLPLIYATIIAIAISPAVNFLVKKKIGRTIAITTIIVIGIVLVSIVIGMLSLQTTLLSKEWPQLSNKFQDLLLQSITWLASNFNISPQSIHDWIARTQSELINNSSSAIGVTLYTMSGFFSAAILTPVYVFMILFYQPHLMEFTHKLFGTGNNNRVSEILNETKTIIQGYLAGLFIEFIIISIMNSVGLLILGIEYAVLLGIVGALLNVIPYIGGAILIVIFMVIALLTKPLIYVFYVVVMYTVIQLIDNNYIVQKIIGSKVKLNALISILAVILGSALWGIPGMFLSIPLTAIIKVIFDRIDATKPWGFLLGDTFPPIVRLKFNFRDMSKKLPHLISPLNRRIKATRHDSNPRILQLKNLIA